MFSSGRYHVSQKHQLEGLKGPRLPKDAEPPVQTSVESNSHNHISPDTNKFRCWKEVQNPLRRASSGIVHSTWTLDRQSMSGGAARSIRSIDDPCEGCRMRAHMHRIQNLLVVAFFCLYLSYRACAYAACVQMCDVVFVDHVHTCNQGASPGMGCRLRIGLAFTPHGFPQVGTLFEWMHAAREWTRWSSIYRGDVAPVTAFGIADLCRLRGK